MRYKLLQYRGFLATCWNYIGEDRMLFVVFVTISILGAVTEGIGISLFVPLLDSVSNKSSFSDIPLLAHMSDAFLMVPAEYRVQLVAVMMLVVVVIRGLLQYFTQFLTVYMPLRIEQRLRLASFDSLLSMSLSAVNASKSGAIQNFLGGYPARIAQVMGYLGNFISNIAMLIIYAGLMMLISVSMTIVSLAFVAVVFLAQRWISTGQLRRSGADVTAASERLSQVVYETLGGLSLIRLCVAGSLMAARNREATEILRSAQTRYGYASSIITPLFMTASGLLICILLFAASMTGRADTTTVGLVLMFLFLLQRLLGPTSTITMARNAIILHMDAVFDFGAWMERARNSIQKDGSLPFTSLKTGIRFSNVTFAYDQESGNVLKGLSFDIPKDKMIAIVGPSGAGKSTIVSLLGRLYDPQGGEVLLDGVDIRNYKIDTWRRNIGVVSQSIFLLNDTVERNLSFGLMRQVESSEIRRAAELAACAEFIESMPQGYQTVLGERGARLSGGQQQRLAIARAILTDPKVLILDEATSQLDSITERAIRSAMNSFRNGRTLIVIAHRMATIQRADKIIVLDGGAVLEEGTHDSLMRAQGRYWDLIEHQRLDIVDVPAEEALTPS